jgi:hypothetical protein
MRNTTTTLLSSLALAIAASPGPAVAHPFAFDTAKMVGFKVLTAEDDAMSADDMVVVRYDGPIAFPMAANLREIWSEIARTPPVQNNCVPAEQPWWHAERGRGCDADPRRDS